MDQAKAKHWGYNVNKTQSRGLSGAKDTSERPRLIRRTLRRGRGHTALLLPTVGLGGPPQGTKVKVKTKFSEMQV